MKISRWKVGLAVGSVVAVGACDAQVDNEGVVARVDDYRLTVDEAVDLLVDEERLAAEAGVVESLAELWIDYTLLAEAAAEDSTFADIDVEPLVRRQIQQVMVFELRDSVIEVDPVISDDDLRAMYEEEAPAMEMRASHIMLQLPVGATQADRDSVRARLQDLRRQVLEGADFAALARRYSQDPGTARRGGDVGFFARGDMVAPFEQAALDLEPGEISDVVRTPMGLHIIRLDERRLRSFEEAEPEYREAVQARLLQEAESVFVAGVMEDVAPEVVEGAGEIVRELASNPASRLSSRAARRPLVEWEGGSITVGELQELLQLENAMLRNEVEGGDTQLIEDFLLSLARRQVLVREAEAAGLRPGPDSAAVLIEDARSQLQGAARSLGLLDLNRAPGEDLEVAVQRAVHEALAENLSGATRVVPLGLVSFQLREGHSVAVLDQGVGQVIVDVAEIRATRQLAPAEEPLMPSDTVG